MVVGVDQITNSTGGPVPVPALESAACSEQIERVASVLTARGFHPEIICDTLGEAIAVRVPRVFGPVEVAPIVASVPSDPKNAEDRVENIDLGDVLPYGSRSGKVYPKRVCDVIDAAMCGILDRSDVVGRRMFGPEGAVAAGIGDGDAHTDFPGNLDDPDVSEVHGFNVHITLGGEGTARFSPVRSFGEVHAIAELLHAERGKGKTIVEINERIFPDLFGPYMKWASDPVHTVAGDILLFQSRPHISKGLLPAVHHFASLTSDRMINILVPKSGTASDTIPLRVEMARRYELGDLGYPTRVA